MLFESRLEDLLSGISFPDEAFGVISGRLRLQFKTIKLYELLKISKKLLKKRLSNQFRQAYMHFFVQSDGIICGYRVLSGR